MSDDLMDALRAIDPVPDGRTDGAARSAWGETTLRRIMTEPPAPAPAPPRPRWRVAALAATGALALVALFLVLVTATGGSDDVDAPAAAGETTIVVSPGARRPVDPNALENALRRRVDALGLEDVALERRGDATAVTFAAPDDRALAAVAQPGYLMLIPRRTPEDRIRLNVAESRVSGDSLIIRLTEASAAEFTAATRRWVQEAATAGRDELALRFALSGGVGVSDAFLDVSDYPRGLDGSAGVEVLTDEPSRDAAILSTPFPPGSWTIRFPDGYDSGVTSPVS